MGNYLNPGNSGFSNMRNDVYVDKTEMIRLINQTINTPRNLTCISRPRRFGKSFAAKMLCAYYDKTCDSKELFDDLRIAKADEYLKYLNKYDVIYLDMASVLGVTSPEDAVSYVKRNITEEVLEIYPEVKEAEALFDTLANLVTYTGNKIIMIIDEWDSPIRENGKKIEIQREYLLFLRSLFKNSGTTDKIFAAVYMTGILPISKYSSGSELNMFVEYTMARSRLFGEYFGFSDQEVDLLYERYCKKQEEPRLVSRDELRRWYDGYATPAGVRLYNPRSVVLALGNNSLDNYWTSSGPYDEIFYYIKNNVDSVRDDLALVVSGVSIPAKIQEYAATSQSLKTKEEILSAMVVYGFLSYENGTVSIPNKELMDQFSDMLRRESSLGYVYQLAKESEKMLRATLSGDTKTMEYILELVHDTETPILAYNHETELSAVVNLVYLAARDLYRVEREEKAGKGFVDFIFYPETNLASDGIILELKVGHSPEDAITQIKEKNYAVRFKGRFAQKKIKPSRILLVGIGYDKDKKKHKCKVEVMTPEWET